MTVFQAGSKNFSKQHSKQHSYIKDIIYIYYTLITCCHVSSTLIEHLPAPRNKQKAVVISTSKPVIMDLHLSLHFFASIPCIMSYHFARFAQQLMYFQSLHLRRCALLPSINHLLKTHPETSQLAPKFPLNDLFFAITLR